MCFMLTHWTIKSDGEKRTYHRPIKSLMMQLPARSAKIVQCFHVDSLNRAAIIAVENVDFICPTRILVLRSAIYLRMHS